MGSPRRLRKLFEGPKKVWDSKRIEEEQKLIEEYGLRNMRELWRVQTTLRKIRREARLLLSITGSEARSKLLLDRVKSFLVPKTDITLDDVLALGMRDILERRLQTAVVRKGLARTFKQSRQLITHGHIAVAGQKCTSPSQLLTFPQEAAVAWFGAPVSAGELSASAKAAEKAAAAKPKEEADEQKPAEAEKSEAPAAA